MKPSDEQTLQADLSAYLDGEFDAARTAEIARYVEQSPDAQRLLEELRAIRGGLATMPRRKAPSELAVAVEREARRQVVFATKPVPTSGRALRWVGRIVGSAAMIAVGVFAGRYYWQTTPSPEATMSRVSDAMRQFDEHRAAEPAPRVAIVDQDELKQLQALGYAGGDETAEDDMEAVFGTTIEDAPAIASARKQPTLKQMPAGSAGARSLQNAAPPPAAMVAPADSVPVDAAVMGRAAGAPPGAVTRELRPEPKPEPAVRVVVTARNTEEYERLAAMLGEWDEYGFDPQHAARMKRARQSDRAAGLPITAGRGGQPLNTVARGQDREAAPLPPPEEPTAEPTERSFAYRIRPERVESVLTELDNRAPEQVQVSMDFRPAELGRVREILTQSYADVPPPVDKRPNAEDASLRKSRTAETKSIERGGGAPAERELALQTEKDQAAREIESADEKRADGNLESRAPASRMRRRAAEEGIPEVAGLDEASASQPTEDRDETQSVARDWNAESNERRQRRVETTPTDPMAVLLRNTLRNFDILARQPMDPNALARVGYAGGKPPERIALEITLLPPPDQQAPEQPASQPTHEP